jgi:hypothetical protein
MRHVRQYKPGITIRRTAMIKRAVLSLALLVTLGGCSPSYEILSAVDGNNGVYLTFPSGARLHEGEIYRIVGAVPPQGHGRLRPVLGRVKVLELRSDTVAFVKVLEGTVANGVSAEKAE